MPNISVLIYFKTDEFRESSGKYIVNLLICNLSTEMQLNKMNHCTIFLFIQERLTNIS